ncbi:hypothetical protein GCM10010319_06830 [Streptomyces blastmyceticus]|uniref:Uncharacterized protein n=2 Tax=Streptomyces blastmyceticus TaxID=68180 RepID=A0ABN0WD84_9ACTN
MAFAPASIHPVVARDLLVGVYLTAALLKINDEYLLTERSAGRVVTAHYLQLLGLRPYPRQLKLVPALVVLTELTVGTLMWVPGGGHYDLWLAILMHLVFGVSGNFPFSVIAMALWVVALTPLNGQFALPVASVSALFPTLLTALLALAARRTARGRRSKSWLLKDFCEGATYGYLCAVAAAAASEPTQSSQALPTNGQVALTHWLIAAGFSVNLLLVVTRVKLEWSFAMFSSLRPFGHSWLERTRLKGWPRYYALTLPKRIPMTLLREVDPEFIYQATRAESAVHENVAYHLENTARKYNISFAPQTLSFDADRSELVPMGEPGQSVPRMRFLNYPALVPRRLDRRYLA